MSMHPTLRALLEAAKACGEDGAYDQDMGDLLGAATRWADAGCPGLDDPDYYVAPTLKSRPVGEGAVTVAVPAGNGVFQLDANEPPTIRVRLSPGAKMPTRATDGSSGWDLYALEDELLTDCDYDLDGPHTVRTGVRISLPPGWEAQVRPRSGLSKLGVVSAFGTVDADYRGEIGVLLTGSRDHYVIKAGDRIAQLVFQRVPTVRLVEVADVAELGETARGEAGFGSSGR